MGSNVIGGQPILLAMDEASRVGEARRAAATLAKRLGFDEAGQGRVAIVATECASNLVKHATCGALILQEVRERQVSGMEILALDNGPGMVDVARLMPDGVSTAGTAGNGLGAIARLSETFSLHSLPGRGTAVLARLRSVARSDPGALEIGAVSLPLPGEDVCGDAWSVEVDGERTRILVVDGLGHGAPAAAAATAAVLAFRECMHLGLEAFVGAAHEALHSTRGAALAVAEIDHSQRVLRFVGVGNVAASVVAPESSQNINLVSHNGTVGHTLRRVQEFVHPWPEQALLLMHTDGVTPQWRAVDYPGLAACHAGVIAGVIYRDFRRGRDDATVVVARERREAP